MRLGLLAAALLASTALRAQAADRLLRAQAAERPSFLIPGETFCTDGIAFEDMLRAGHPGPHAAASCRIINRVTRVVVQNGGPGRALVWIASGPLTGVVGWTNGHLPP